MSTLDEDTVRACMLLLDHIGIAAHIASPVHIASGLGLLNAYKRLGVLGVVCQKLDAVA